MHSSAFRILFSTVAGTVALSLALLLAVDWIETSHAEDVAASSAGTVEDIEALLVSGDTEILPAMPVEAVTIVTSFDRSAADIRRRAAREIREVRLQAVRKLKALQDAHTREAMLDEAVAIRDTIRHMLQASLPTIDNPGTMSGYANQLGKSFLIRVTGRTTGTIYGTEYYTYDSDVATACVHSGALRDQETGVVTVSMLNTGEPHRASIQHGVRSREYGPYPGSYTVRRWRPSAEEIELGSLQLE